MRRPETAAYIAKALQSLKEARIVVGNELPDAAGRAAYLAGYHAAQALIFSSAMIARSSRTKAYKVSLRGS